VPRPTGIRREPVARQWVDDLGGHGARIVREIRACKPCAAKAAAIDRDVESPVRPQHTRLEVMDSAA
jgi:hypothetical protein